MEINVETFKAQRFVEASAVYESNESKVIGKQISFTLENLTFSGNNFEAYHAYCNMSLNAGTLSS